MKLSVVIPSYNRPPLVRRLVGQLGRQTLARSEYEVIVVDDGSEVPLTREALDAPPELNVRVLRQENGGAATARHTGALSATAATLVFVDDDMQVEPDFLEHHAAHHTDGRRRVVIGRLRPDPALERMPFFERWHAHLMDRTAARLKAGTERAQGALLYTGNVSLPREDYLAVGGFDPTLRLSEDIDLGFRLERAGLEFAYSDEAATLHGSDRSTVAAWRSRALRYGACDLVIARKHPALRRASPFRLLFEIHPATRLLGAVALVAPWLGRVIAAGLLRGITLAEKTRAERAVLAATSVLYTVDYFTGLGRAVGPPHHAVREVMAFAATHQPTAPR